MNYRFDAEIIMNGITGSGIVEVNGDVLTFEIGNQRREVTISSISDYILGANETVVVTFDDNESISFRTNECENFISILSKIKNTVDPSIIAGVEEGSPKIEVKALVYSIIAFFASLFLGVMFIDSDLLSAIFSLVRFVSFVIFVFSLISMLFSSFKNAADAVKYFDNDKKRSSSLYNFCMVAVPIFLIVFPIIYHNVGPRGAVNNCFSNELPTFVSCRKSTELGGTTVYSCFRRGAKAVVSCDGDTCNAICEV